MYSKRINTIIAAVQKCATLADVGCDHGYIGAGVLAEGKADHVFFCDISEPSLNKARALCGKIKFANENASFSFHFQDGLGGLKPDAAVIAGMGGMEMISILSKACAPETLVLQPSKNVRELRQYLFGKYIFLHEFVVHDIKFYPLIIVRRGNVSNLELTETQNIFGINPCIDDDYRAYVKYRYREIVSILEYANSAALLREKELIENYFSDIL